MEAVDAGALEFLETALRIGGRRSASPSMRSPLTTFSGELECGAGIGSGGQRERMTAAMRAMGELDAKDQEEVLRYMARPAIEGGRP